MLAEFCPVREQRGGTTRAAVSFSASGTHEVMPWHLMVGILGSFGFSATSIWAGAVGFSRTENPFEVGTGEGGLALRFLAAFALVTMVKPSSPWLCEGTEVGPFGWVCASGRAFVLTVAEVG
jgi:hypothetical protein